MPARGTGLNGVSVRENGATNRLPLMALAGGNATARRASPVLSASTRGLRNRVEELNVGHDVGRSSGMPMTMARLDQRTAEDDEADAVWEAARVSANIGATPEEAAFLHDAFVSRVQRHDEVRPKVIAAHQQTRDKNRLHAKYFLCRRRRRQETHAA